MEDIEDVLEKFQEIVKTRQYEHKFFVFLDETDLEEEYSHKQISNMHRAFIEKAAAWLKQYYPGKFVLYHDWSIHLLTAEYVKLHCPSLIPYIIQ